MTMQLICKVVKPFVPNLEPMSSEIV